MKFATLGSCVWLDVCALCVALWGTQSMCAAQNKSSLSEPVTVYLRSAQREELDRIGAEEERSLSFLLRQAVDEFLARRHEKAREAVA